MPALWEVLRGSLGDEVADDFGGRLVEVRGQIFELLTCRVIEPQREAVGISTRTGGTLAWCRLLLAGGEILDGDLAHHMAQSWSGLQSRSGDRFLHLLMEFGWDVEVEVAH
jgi:hypothetical protein